MTAGHRSSLLLHWTGRNIERPGEQFNPSQPRAPLDLRQPLEPTHREAYVERLASILTGGMWLSRFTETVVYTPAPNALHGYTWHVRAACFTEVRLTQAHDHASLYGRVALGFTRRWVLDRFGGPVHYVRSSPGADPITANFAALVKAAVIRVERARKSGVTDQEAEQEMQRLIELQYFVKKMSYPSPIHEDFALLQEHEWRIALIDRLKATGFITEGDDRAVLNIRPEDVRLIVFPDAETQEIALARADLRPFLRRDPTPPIMMTIEDTEQF